MTEFPPVVLVLGRVLIAQALPARYEVMARTAGWRTGQAGQCGRLLPVSTLTHG